MKNKLLLKLIAAIALLWILPFGAKAVNPTYTMRIVNDIQTAPNEYQWDVQIKKNVGSDYMELANVQMGWRMNQAIIPTGGTLSMTAYDVTTLSGTTPTPAPPVSWCASSKPQGATAGIYPSQVPITGNHYPFWNTFTPNCGAGGGFVITTPDVWYTVGRFKLSCTLPFNSARPDLVWWYTAIPKITVVTCYVGGINTNVTVQASNILTDASNPVLNPTPYVLSGSVQLCPNQLPTTVTLSNSQTGASYQLYKDGIAYQTPQSGTTGSALNWSVTDFGNYTCMAGTTPMTGNADVTTPPAPTTLGSISGPAIVHVGDMGVSYSVATNSFFDVFSFVSPDPIIHPTVPAGGSSVLIDFPAGMTPGNYRLFAKGQNACGVDGPESFFDVLVEVATPQVIAQTVTESASYCELGAGKPIGLANSEVGVTYNLYKLPDLILPIATVTPTVAGAFSFGLYTAGTYHVTGTLGAFTLDMLNEVTITATQAVTPTFTQLGPYCQGATPASLPAISDNLIAGTWSPDVISTLSAGPATYTFTATAQGCYNQGTMVVTVNAPIDQPVQNQTQCGGTYTWPVNSQEYLVSGDYQYLDPINCEKYYLHLVINTMAFEPVQNQTQCGGTYTWPVNGVEYLVGGDYTYVNNCTTYSLHLVINTMAFEPVQNQTQCGGTYTWPVNGVEYLVGGDYTYVNNCTTYALHLVINTAVAPTFAPVAPICSGGTITLPAASIEGITGTWLPIINNLATTTYTFAPDAPQCATTATITVVVNTGTIVPTFYPFGPYVTAPTGTVTLPVISNNGINGVWSPAGVNLAVIGTSAYVFTPNPGQCATAKTVNITVIPAGWHTSQDIGTTLFLSWTPVPLATTYAIYWRPHTGGAWIANAVNVPYCKAINLTPGVLYDCRYIAYRSNGTMITNSASTIYGDYQFTPAVPVFEKRYDIGTVCEIGWPDWSDWASSYVLQYRALPSGTWIGLAANINYTKLSSLIASLPGVGGYECRVVVYRNGSMWGTTAASPSFQTTDVVFTPTNINTAHTACVITWPSQAPWATGHHFYYRIKAVTPGPWIALPVGINDFINLSGLTPNVDYECKLGVYKSNNPILSPTAANFYGETAIGTFNLGVGTKEVSSTNESNGINVYPNPFIDQINMDLFAQEATKVTWNIYDMTGKVVLSGSESVTTGYSTLNIDATELSKGVYMLNALMNDQRQSFRIMKQ
jgi:hypothetical protein